MDEANDHVDRQTAGAPVPSLDSTGIPNLVYLVELSETHHMQIVRLL